MGTIVDTSKIRMAKPVTSFQKKSRVKPIQINGTRPSLHNNQLLVSTGIPSLDGLLGGGVAVGTVILLEEDKYGSYSRLMLKYFCAESVMCGHKLLLASADENAKKILSGLPGPITDDPVKTKESSFSDEKMTIAWRYQNLPVEASHVSNKFGHYYDLTKSMDAEKLENADTVICDVQNSDSNQNCMLEASYANLLESINDVIETGEFGTSGTPQQRNILRVAVHSLGSPMWGDSSSDNYITYLCRFLYTLRSIVRTAYAVCLVTIPSHLMQDIHLIHRLIDCCDTALRLDSFAGIPSKENNPVYKEYHGLFHINKLPRLNSLTCHVPDTLDLAFKLKRKKFMIERLHLPPDLSETASRSQEDALNPMQSACSSGMTSKLDF